MHLYEQLDALNLFKTLVLVVAVSSFGSAVRTGMALRNSRVIVHNSILVFVVDQLGGVLAGFAAFAVLVEWFDELRPLTQLAIIGLVAWMSSELLAVTKNELIMRWRAALAHVFGVPVLEQKIEPKPAEQANQTEGGES